MQDAARTVRFKTQRALVALILLASTSGCVGVPDGVTPVSGFEIDRYLGTWYEIARLDHRFERGLSDVTATYSLREDGGVKVVNRGWNAEAEVWNEAVGRAEFVAEPDVARLKVSFFGPFYGGYNVIDLDREGYQRAVVSGPDRSYLWILAREPQLEADEQARLVAKAEALGFPAADLIFVEHGRADAAANR